LDWAKAGRARSQDWLPGPKNLKPLPTICLNNSVQRESKTLSMTPNPILLPALLILSSLPLAGWEKDVNTAKPGPHLKIRPVALSYQMSWNGALNSGRANFIFGRKDKRYPNDFIAQLYGASGGVARAFHPYDYAFTSFLRKTDYTPRLFVGSESDAREKISTTNRFGRRFRSTEVTTPHKKGAKATTRTSGFKHTRHTVYDLLSTILYVRSLPLKKGDESVIVMHPFASPYLARVKVLGREVHRGRNCIKLDLRLQKIDAATGKLKSYKKMKTALMWLSNDRERLPIEIRVDAFIGDVRAVLDGRKYL
jgi:hypothetical protein